MNWLFKIVLNEYKPSRPTGVRRDGIRRIVAGNDAIALWGGGGGIITYLFKIFFHR